MLSELLSDNIQFKSKSADWESAIKESCEPLIDGGYINEEYIKDIIDSVHKNGSYFVLLPKIALPHASSNGNVAKSGISILKLNSPVKFPDEKFVEILITVASKDSQSHMDVISAVGELLIDEEERTKLLSAQTITDIKKII